MAFVPTAAFEVREGAFGKLYNFQSGVYYDYSPPYADASVTANGFTYADNIAETGSSFTALTVPDGGTGVATLTGIVKGNGASAFSAAVAGADYSVGTAALATGIIKSTTTTGSFTIAVAGDFPTLNQNTTGSAATVPASGLTGATLAAGVTASSLTSAGALTVSSLTSSGLVTAAKGASNGVTIGNVSTNENAILRLQGTSVGSNWQLANNVNFAGFEISPSTVGGGTTYSTPVFTLDANGNTSITGVFAAPKGAAGGITIGDVSTDNNARLRLQGTSVGRNWQIANNLNFSGLEITPSTAAGGTTYTTPVWTLASDGTLTVTGPIKAQGYTVSTLPAGVVGQRAYVTDALAPAFGAPVADGGAVVTPVFRNATVWVVG